MRAFRGAAVVLVSMTIFGGCADPVEVWPPDWHPAHAGSAAPATAYRAAALTGADPVEPAREGVVPPNVGTGEHSHHHDHTDANNPEPEVVYVCPMHPDVTSDRPAKCSKCGMALVKKPSAGGK
jgi:hypothetical protein